MLTGTHLHDCLKKYPRFQLIHMVSKRADELHRGAKALVDSQDPSPIGVAIQEIAEGRIYCEPVTTAYLEKLEEMMHQQQQEEEE